MNAPLDSAEEVQEWAGQAEERPPRKHISPGSIDSATQRHAESKTNLACTLKKGTATDDYVKSGKANSVLTWPCS